MIPSPKGQKGLLQQQVHNPVTTNNQDIKEQLHQSAVTPAYAVAAAGSGAGNSSEPAGITPDVVSAV